MFSRFILKNSDANIIVSEVVRTNSEPTEQVQDLIKSSMTEYKKEHLFYDEMFTISEVIEPNWLHFFKKIIIKIQFSNVCLFQNIKIYAEQY